MKNRKPYLKIRGGKAIAGTPRKGKSPVSSAKVENPLAVPAKEKNEAIYRDQYLTDQTVQSRIRKTLKPPPESDG